MPPVSVRIRFSEGLKVCSDGDLFGDPLSGTKQAADRFVTPFSEPSGEGEGLCMHKKLH